MTRLDRVPVSPRSARSFRTTMVLETAERHPNHRQDCQSQPSNRPSPNPKPAVASSWIGVPINAMRRTGANRSTGNSRPTVNNRRATPMSARTSTSSKWTTVGPPVLGPTTMPAKM